jgi:hypothetical protein
MTQIHIYQFNAQYNTTSSLEHPAALQRRLDQIAMDLLADALEARFSDGTASDEPVYFIEQMAVDLTVDAAKLDDHQLATTWAKSLQEGIARTLSQGGSGVIVFSNRGEFLASFLRDLLAGQAWTCWYYQEFAALRSLSTGQAILTVLTTDGDTGREALLTLTQQGQLDRLLALLSDAEVEAIARSCLLPSSPSVVLPNTVSVWIQAVRSRLQQGVTLTGILARDLTRLYLELLRHRPELGPDVNLARFIHNLLQLRQTVMARDDVAQFLQQLAADRWMGVLSQLDRSPAKQLLTTLMREVSGAEVVELLQNLQVDAPQTTSHLGVTPYGGIFLLVGAIADLELQDFLERCPYPEPKGMSKAGLLLWLVALQCLGRQNAVQAQHDRGLALFAGLSHPPESSYLQEYAAALTPAMHEAFAQMFQAHYNAVSARPGLFIYRRGISSEFADLSDWFSLYSDAEPLLPNPQWDLTLAIVSSVVLQWFVAKLGAFAGSSPPFISQNFLESQAMIEVSSVGVTVRFLTCPLQMVLRMAGFDHNSWEVPWLENRQLTFQFD